VAWNNSMREGSPDELEKENVKHELDPLFSLCMNNKWQITRILQYTYKIYFNFLCKDYRLFFLLVILGVNSVFSRVYIVDWWIGRNVRGRLKYVTPCSAYNNLKQYKYKPTICNVRPCWFWCQAILMACLCFLLTLFICHSFRYSFKFLAVRCRQSYFIRLS
jgi:hypothetical protein